MRDFLVQLRESGHVGVLPYGLERQVGEPADTADVLRQMDHDARAEFPGNAPAYVWAAAHWAAETFYRACQLLVCRDVPAGEAHRVLAAPCPLPATPETHYSVDLVFRFLPDLFLTARRVAAGDALVDALRALSLAWPLSSVGVDGTGCNLLPRLDSLLAHPGLRTLYSDRIIRHRDGSRLSPPRVRTTVIAALGEHAEVFWPGFAKLDLTEPLPVVI